MSNLRAKYGITIFDQQFWRDTQVDCYVEVLQALSERDPDFLQNLARHQDRKIRLVARNLEDLHADHMRRPSFVKQHAKHISGGWLVWANASKEHVIRNIVYACTFAGVEYGREVHIDCESWGSKHSDLTSLLED